MSLLIEGHIWAPDLGYLQFWFGNILVYVGNIPNTSFYLLNKTPNHQENFIYLTTEGFFFLPHLNAVLM